MENKTQSDLQDKVWGFSDMDLMQIYRLRNYAKKSDNVELLSAIKSFLNVSYGAEGKPATHLQLKSVSIKKVLAMLPPAVKVVIDHEIVDTNTAETRSHELRELIHDKFDGKIKVTFHSGMIDGDNLRDDHVVLLALNTGFAVLKARGTETAGCIVVHPDLSEEARAIELQKLKESLRLLLAQRQQYKEDLESGKITPAEHQKFVESMSAAERHYAIYAKSGSTGTPEFQRKLE